MGIIDKRKKLFLKEDAATVELANIVTAATQLAQNQTEQTKKLFNKLRGNTAVRVERALRKMEEKKMKRLKRRKEVFLYCRSFRSR
jgi:hypothetical protein